MQATSIWLSFTRTGVCRFEFQIIRGIHGLVHCSSGVPVPGFTWTVLLGGSSQVLAGSASSLEVGTEKRPVSLRVWRSPDSGIKEWVTLLPNIFHTLYSCDVNYHQRIVVVVRRGKSSFLALCQCLLYVMLRTASLQKRKPHRRRCQSIGTYPGMCLRFSTPTYLVSVLGLSQNHSQPVVWSVDLLCELESEIWIDQNGVEHNQRLSSWNSSSCSSQQDHLVSIFKQCFHNVHRSRASSPVDIALCPSPLSSKCMWLPHSTYTRNL